LRISVLQQAGRSLSNRLLTKYWTHNTGSTIIVYTGNGRILV